MRFAAFISTFDRPSILRDTLQQILAQTRAPEYVLVVDNGTNPETEQIASSFPVERVGYHRMGKNAGPAGAGAYALTRLVDAGYEWIFCGDDDDPPFELNTFERLLNLAARARPPVGAVGATGSLWSERVGGRVPVREVAPDGICYVDVIGGARQLIVSREAVLRAGPPRAELFFGLEDFEFCLRIRKAGFAIAVDPALFAEYSRMLDQRRTRPPPHRGALRMRHEIWRQYYNTRNYICLMRGELGRERHAAREVFRAMGRSVLSWSRGWSYGLEFTRMEARGVLDGYRGRLGATVLPRNKYAGEARAGRGASAGVKREEVS